MPTGYTAQLQDMKYDVKRWLKESAIRAMGVCVMLRDHSGKMSQDQIADALKENTNSDFGYHTKALKDAQKHLKETELREPDEWKKEYEASVKAAEKDYAASLAKWEKGKAAHEKALRECQELQARAKRESANEVVQGTLKFAIEQITQTIGFDYDRLPYKDSVLEQTLAQWKRGRYESAVRQVAYHEKELEKAKARHYDRYNAYKEFIEFVDKANSAPRNEAHT